MFSLLYVSCSFEPWLFSLCPSPSVLSFPTAIHRVGVGVSFVTVSPSLLLFSCHSIFGRSVVVQSALSSSRGFVLSIGVTWCVLCGEEVSTESFYVAILTQNLHFFFVCWLSANIGCSGTLHGWMRIKQFYIPPVFMIFSVTAKSLACIHHTGGGSCGSDADALQIVSVS